MNSVDPDQTAPSVMIIIIMCILMGPYYLHAW